MEHSDSVTTMDYRNNLVFFGDFLWSPLWFRVRITSRTGDDGIAWVAEEGWKYEKPLEVEFVRCACGMEFVRDRSGLAWKGGRPNTKNQCKACDQRQRAASQRNRRLRRRRSVLAKRCVRCGDEMAPQRRTRKYCSDACRIAAMRRRCAEQRAVLGV